MFEIKAMTVATSYATRTPMILLPGDKVFVVANHGETSTVEFGGQQFEVRTECLTEKWQRLAADFDAVMS